MARSIDKRFYKSTTWERCSKDYLKYCGGLCELCKAKGLYVPAKIVHHKIHLNSENVSDPSIAYGFDNLMAVCLDCHNTIHFGGNKRYLVDELGRVRPLGVDLKK